MDPSGVGAPQDGSQVPRFFDRFDNEQKRFVGQIEIFGLVVPLLCHREQSFRAMAIGGLGQRVFPEFDQFSSCGPRLFEQFILVAAKKTIAAKIQFAQRHLALEGAGNCTVPLDHKDALFVPWSAIPQLDQVLYPGVLQAGDGFGVHFRERKGAVPRRKGNSCMTGLFVLDPSGLAGWISGFVRNKDTFREDPFPRGTEVEIEITTLTNMGQGLGRVSLSESTEKAGEEKPGRSGWVVLVPFALPGERVRVRIWRNQKNFSDGDVVEVLRSSEHRVEPPCPLFEQCGGCQYQNLAYTEQLNWKRRQVAELLEHMAGLTFPVNPVISSPRSYGYRSKITPHFQKPQPDRPVDIGFLRAGSRRAVVDVERCLLATDAINETLTAERAAVRARASSYEKGATLLLRDAAEGVVTNPASIIHEKVGDLRLHFPAGEFFQNNPFVLESFAGHVRRQAAAGGARFLVDAYCGSGLFCLTAARSFEHATGIEISEPSIRWARENAAENGLGNCSFVAGDAAAIFARVDYPASETAVVIDPPRRGSDESFLSQLVAFGPRTVVYVSCNPATQMRDLKWLLEAGYELREVQPFDLFPQTKHLECVITLSRTGM